MYGDAHRGGIVISCLLAALAVLMAVVGGVLHVRHCPALYVAITALLEVLAIFAMWMLHVSSRTDGWNAAYTDSRILAEALRLMQFLAPLGVHTPYGFASQMECQRLSLRASSMERLFEERSKALNSLILSDPSRPEAVWGLAREGLATASLLIDEAAGWSMLYRHSDIRAG